ncbi:hypothetical protein Hanom_Chr05g00473651 [Helianthus anomalus]
MSMQTFYQYNFLNLILLMYFSIKRNTPPNVKDYRIQQKTPSNINLVVFLNSNPS